MVKKGEKLSEEHKRKIGEGVRRQSAMITERQQIIAEELSVLATGDPSWRKTFSAEAQAAGDPEVHR